ncbi:MAG: pyruvate kinase [Candidatus Pacebacteria bacterium]|nr:pyruvate kinase [Candidatus Paceibacterota bacterium]
MHQSFKTRTKIVGTIGPTCDAVPVIEKMIKEGLTVARINMSHGDHKTHAVAIKNARAASKKAGQPLAILQDLSGPKIRIGDFTTEEVTLVNGKKLTLTTKACDGSVDKVFVNYPKLPNEVEVGMDIYLNDGKQKLVVTKIAGKEIHTKILAGGTIKGRRGVNLPDADLSVSSLTAKDKKDLVFGISQNVDFITLSFVRTAADIHLLRKLIGNKSKASIVAKIETKSAIENLDEIIEAADVIMVARGDLAIEMPVEQVPLLQKKIIRIANRLHKPVITATQMLDSMRVSTTPTRAEVLDIANAILDGTDALMLSDETAVGLYPSKAVAMMTKVAREIENDDYFINKQKHWDFPPETVVDAVGNSIAHSVRATNTKVIVALSEGGGTSKVVARYRPNAPILVITPNEETFRQSLIIFGCIPVLNKKIKNLDGAQTITREIIKERKLGKKGDTFILSAGLPFGTPGSTNVMLIEKV